MGDHSKIEWTDATWNPTRGCAIKSKGCANCYAMRQAHRHSGAGDAYEGLTAMTKGGPVWTGEVRLQQELLDWPIRKVAPHSIFVDSMSDLFYGDDDDRRQCEKRGVPFEPIPFEFIADVFAVMACTTRHKYQVLTKRPQRMVEWFEWLQLDHFKFPEQVQPTKVWPQWTPCRGGRGGYDNCGPLWPLENVWIGVSVEDQAAADERIPLLLQAPAAVRWISAEPLLGPISFVGRWVEHKNPAIHENWLERIHWVVAGGESGPGARPMHPDWARDLRDQCAALEVPFFFKQWGAWTPIDYVDQDTRHRLVKLTFTDREKAIGGPAEGTTPYNVKRVGKKAAGRELDGRTHDEYPA